VVTSISLHPVLVIIGPLTENFLADHRNTARVTTILGYPTRRLARLA
jgi:hypothetical protein